MVTFIVLLSMSAAAHAKPGGNIVLSNEDGVLLINGKKTFPIMVTMPPPVDGSTPDGGDALRELRAAGVNFMRSGAFMGDWDDAQFAREVTYLDAAAERGMYCATYLRELSVIGPESPPEHEQRLREVIHRFKDHPGLGVWKGSDEPEWGKKPVETLVRTREIVEEIDGNHPIWIVQAPRGTEQSLRKYDPTYHITGVDIYPVSYPPGVHSLLPNEDISVVGDHVKIMMRVAEGKPVWATLQIAWSGVLPSRGRTIRFPTFAQQRYMTYQAIACGARGLVYFGGHIEQVMNDRDRELGWNWTFWERVLRPVLEEINEDSPLHPALLAPDSDLPIRAPGLEYVVREVGDEIFIIATRRRCETKEITFTGLPEGISEGEVLFEEPRRVQVRRQLRNPEKPETETGVFSDWFGPFDVHVYRFRRGG
jgi:hypothetical protein